jgi:hypothetical protein
VSGPLPRLLDRKQLAAELGCKRSVVDAIFLALETVHFPGSRKPLVRRDDVLRLIEDSTYDGRTRVR